MKNGIGIAFAGAWKAAEVTSKVTTAGLAVQTILGLDVANALPTSNESTTALARRDGGSRDRDNATALYIDHLRKLGVTDQGIQKVLPGRYENDTSLYGPKETRGIPLKKKLQIARFADHSRSRKVTPSGEIAQSTRETHQGEQDKNKGKELSEAPLEAEKPQQRFLAASLNANPEVLRQLKKLNDKKVRERSPLEKDAKIPATRTLLSDEKSACSLDPCSDIPASVDCIKQCTTGNVFGGPGPTCLDISTSEVYARIENASPGQQVHLDYNLSVQNNCPQAVNQIYFRVDTNCVCPPDTSGSIGDFAQGFSLDQSLTLAPGNFAGVNGSADWPCQTTNWEGFTINSSIPSALSSLVSADAWMNTEYVLSQGENFIVLGPSVDGCDQTCSPTKPPAPGTLSIVFIHGFKAGPEANTPIGYTLTKGDGSGFNCTEYWGDAKTFLSERGLGGDLRTIKYYNHDRDCDNGNSPLSSDLHDDLYKSLCTDYHAGPEGTHWEGTNDESIYHLSCLFAQYLNYNFGRANREVILVGHSMGGLIMRETLFQVQTRTDQSPFPTTIGHVTKAITFNTPHEGSLLANLKEMDVEVVSKARNSST
jgi:hypothetical protein